MQSIFYYSLIIISFLIAVWDFLYYQIPNKLLIIMLMIYVIFAIYMQYNHQSILSWPAVILTTLCFVIGIILFYFNFLGAGDAKYLCLATLWMYPINIVDFFFITSITGAVIALLMLSFETYWTKLRIYLFSKVDKKNTIYIPQKMVPYGIAISCGIILTIIKEKIYLS